MTRLQLAGPRSTGHGARVPARAQPSPTAHPAASHGPIAALVALQRTAGNRATERFIQRCRDGHT
jgi:hypothetical protein